MVSAEQFALHRHELVNSPNSYSKGGAGCKQAGTNLTGQGLVSR